MTNGLVAAFYTFIAFASAFHMVPLVRRIGPGPLHAACLTAGGLSMLALPYVTVVTLLYLPAVGVDLAWGIIMGNPYANLLHNNSRKMLSVCGVCFILAALSVLWVKEGRANATAPELALA